MRTEHLRHAHVGETDKDIYELVKANAVDLSVTPLARNATGPDELFVMRDAQL